LIHEQKAAGHLTFGCLCLAALFAVGNGRMPYGAVKQTTERTKTLKPNFKANVSDPEIFRTQQLLGFFDPPRHQILMRSLIKRLSKEAQKMISGETGLAGNLVKVQGQVVATIDKITSTIQALERVRSRGHARLSSCDPGHVVFSVGSIEKNPKISNFRARRERCTNSHEKSQTSLPEFVDRSSYSATLRHIIPGSVESTLGRPELLRFDSKQFADGFICGQDEPVLYRAIEVQHAPA
jgi:hypothetical protein